MSTQTPTVKITTNNNKRPIIDAEQLSLSARAHFDYLDWEAIKDGRESASFFRYKGQLYDLGEFQRIDPATISAHATKTHENREIPPFQGWHGYQSDSFFSGILVRYPTTDTESIIVGTYYSS